MKSNNENNQTTFMAIVGTPYGKACAKLLIESLRTFGGELRDAPFWIFEIKPDTVSCTDLESLGVKTIPINTPEPLSNYFFGHKVYACAQAESLVSSGTHSLVCFDVHCLIVQPPSLFSLGSGIEAAFRPVHVQNVGLLADEPLDIYWQKIYETIGVTKDLMTVETFVDKQRLRAYFNTHVFSVNPSKGWMGQWLTLFESLLSDHHYQATACNDAPHQIFLFQALLSTLIANTIEPERLRILPPEYNYPYNLQHKVPTDRLVQKANDIVTFVYEGRSINPREIQDIDFHDPLLGWLLERENDLPKLP